MSADHDDLRAKLLAAQLAQDAIAEREQQEELAEQEPAIRAALQKQIADETARRQAEYEGSVENARTVLAVAVREHEAWLAELVGVLAAFFALIEKLPSIQ